VIHLDGVSRFDVAICLRLLERKFLRVETGLWISTEPDIGALGDIRPCWADELGCAETRLREASFSIQIEARPLAWTDTDEYDGTLLHELVHATQLERRGLVEPESTADFTRERSAENGGLDWADSVEYYRRFRTEHQAKEQEIRLVLGPANRDYWRGVLAGAA
jgi:hypothetical protein